MIYLVLFMLWEISLVLAFVGGRMTKSKKKPAAVSKPPTEEEKRQADKLQKELENFMRYDGTEQDAVE